MAAASASQRPFWAGVPPVDLSSYSSRSTFKPAANTYPGYVSHSLCQLVDQPRTAGQPVDTFGCLSKVEPERLPTVSVDHRNATCRPAAPLVAAWPHCHQVAMRPSRPHRNLMAAVAARPDGGHCRPAIACRTHMETPQAARTARSVHRQRGGGCASYGSDGQPIVHYRPVAQGARN